jgi:hypothetical protein
LSALGALPTLMLHVKLVGEAAEQLIAKFNELQIQVDAQWVRLGVAFHDAGKILYPEELRSPGIHHETEGETLLIQHGIDPKIARCCRSHGQWQSMDCSLEELLVALADTLWKGKRKPDLEGLVIRKIVDPGHPEYWTIFLELDACFEAIAADGDSRLLRSQFV